MITVESATAEVQSLRGQEAAEQRHLARAHEADAVLNNPLVVDAFEKLESQVRKAWETTARADVGSREYLYDVWMHLKDFRGYFEELVRTGELAAPSLKSLQARRELGERRLQMARR